MRILKIKFPLLTGIFFCIALSGCTGLKYVPKDEKLYTGYSITFKSQQPLPKRNRKNLKNIASSVIRPKPNKKLLVSRPKLWFYYVAGDTSKSKFRRFVQAKLGEPPVYISTVLPSQTAKYIDAAFYNVGIFRSSTTYSANYFKRTASIDYVSSVHIPFRFDTITYPSANEAIEKEIRLSRDQSLIKTGDFYSLQTLKNERDRIDKQLKEKGFFYFRPDYIKFIADTNESKSTVNIHINLSDNIPDNAKRIFRIGQVSVDQTYSLKSDSLRVDKDTVHVDDVIFKGKNTIRPKVILRSVFLKHDDIYSRENHSMTLSRLMSMGNFKFITIAFPESDSEGVGRLDVNIDLTPTPKRTARAELQLISKSNDFVGPALNLSYKNRNTFNGAELFTLNLAGSFETQFSGQYKGLYSYNVGPNIEFLIPKFVVPFKITKQPRGYYIPQTKIDLGYDYLKRVGFYSLNSLNFSYGYKWKINLKIDNEFNPLFITYSQIRNTSDEFDSLLAVNSLLKQSFEQQFIVGLNYTYSYNEQVIPNKRNQIYVTVKPEIAGNTLSFINRISKNEKADADHPSTFLGNVYSQYARLAIDTRDYYNFSSKSKMVFRVYSGIGLPYGNSSTLPYTKQFFSGGPNSIRAFRLNSLGPGNYLRPETDGNLFFDQGGELKFEANTEYRFGIYRLIKGALFVDAGNIWLINKNPDIDVAPFTFNDFLPDLAAGSGFGIRVDATFFVVRFDLAFPIRKPWYEGSDKWVINTIAFGDPSWRKNNLILNFAIGYPF